MSTLHVGLLVPSSNTVMEPDFQRALAGVATVHAARMHLADPVTPDGERVMLDRHALPAARDLETLGPDLVVFGCTSAGMLLGRDGNSALLAHLAEATGARVVGVADALADALRAAGARRISILTPYTEDMNALVAREFVAGGFEVLAAAGMGVGENLAVGRIEPAEILRDGRRAVAAGSDALAIACTNFRALEARDDLASVLGLPVVTANSAALDAVRRDLAVAA